MLLKLTLAQSDLYWEDKAANLAMFSQKCLDAGNTDVLVLPEMFNTGFSMNTELAETMQGPSLRWMRKEAAKHNIALCGSLAIREEGAFYNRFVWVDAQGNLSFYDKHKLFALGQEAEHFSPGKKKCVVEYKGWRIALFVCYDLRFPAWNRNPKEEPYDLAIYVASWPVQRVEHWKQLLRARAIENQAYVVGVNRVGKDGNGLDYSGESSCIDPLGDIIYQQANTEDLATVLCNKSLLEDTRKRMPFLQDQDAFFFA